MKTIQFSIDLRSFFLGAVTLAGILLLANFKPTTQNQADSGSGDNRRYQAVASERESIILDTHTGQFVVMPSYIGQPRRIKYDFNEIKTKD